VTLPGIRLQLLLAALAVCLPVRLICAAESSRVSYLLGPGDRISVSVGDLKEIEIKPASVELDGTVDFQYAGRLQASGLTCGQLSLEVERRLLAIVREPTVRMEVIEYGSQPVSILGSVNKPGVHQLKGPKNLVEVLAMAEGLKLEAGNLVKITRTKAAGPIPLPGAKVDSSGDFTTGEASVKALLEARSPELNIQIRPHDVISVPRADLIYVLGNVRKPGGFPLAERESMTILQALSLAEGVDALGAPQSARIIRTAASGMPSTEVAVDVKKILSGKMADQALHPNDILFVPNSRSRSVGLRALEAGIQMGTGIAIFRR
jgi:polysaccharide biosynthesis/export protein